MNYHQIGTALHKEYEAKYSVQETLHDAEQDAKSFPSKFLTLFSVTVVAVAISLISILA